MQRRDTWVKQWRKELQSDIWDQPLLYLKVWQWLKMSVDYKTGSIETHYDHIADRVQWTERNAPVIPHRTTIMRILNWLHENEMCNKEVMGSGNRKWLRLTVVNWEVYQLTQGEIVTEKEGRLLQTSDSIQEVKKLQEVLPPPPPPPRNAPPLMVVVQTATPKMKRRTGLRWTPALR